MRKILILLFFAPLGLLGQNNIEVKEQNSSKKYKKPIKSYKMETADAKIREVVVQPMVINSGSISTDASESNKPKNNNQTSNEFIKPE